MDSANLNMVCMPSDDIVAREIEGELIIIPLVSGIGDIDDELYTMNETGKAIWRKMDGIKTLKALADELVEEYDAPLDKIEQDVTGLISELIRRKMVVQVA